MNKGNEFAKKRSRDYGCAASLAVIRAKPVMCAKQRSDPGAVFWYPLIGFFIPWFLVRVIYWIGSGFSSKAKTS